MKNFIKRDRLLSFFLILSILTNCFLGGKLIYMEKPGGGGGDDIQENTDIEQMTPDILQDIQGINKEIAKLQNSVYTLQNSINTIDNAILAAKVEELCAGKSSDEEKVIAIAQWICANVSGRGYDYQENKVQNNPFGWFATRNGLCNARAHIFVTMIEFLNLDAHVMNLYDFPSAQSGHSTAEVYYDDKWHFFDPTNGGYFKNRNGEIMSLEEMHQNPDEAMQGMVVFEETLDQIDNYERMDFYYSVDSLRDLSSYAVNNREEVAVVYPQVDMATISVLEIGELDESDEDVRLEGMDYNLSQFLGCALAKPSLNANIQTKWEFKNCQPDQEYYIEYNFWNGKAGEFNIISENATIIEGNNLMLDENGNETGSWKIIFMPLEEECSILITHDYMEAGVGAFVDSIRIGSVAFE